LKSKKVGSPFLPDQVTYVAFTNASPLSIIAASSSFRHLTLSSLLELPATLDEMKAQNLGFNSKMALYLQDCLKIPHLLCHLVALYDAIVILI